MIVGIFIFLLFIIMATLGVRLLNKEEKAIKDFIGRNHASLVTSHSVGGDYHFDEMNDEELYDFLKNIYEMCHDLPYPCINADDSSHLAEFNIFTDEIILLKP